MGPDRDKKLLGTGICILTGRGKIQTIIKKTSTEDSMPIWTPSYVSSHPETYFTVHSNQRRAKRYHIKRTGQERI